MKNFIKQIFCTKYRIYPIYSNKKLCGYVVYERVWYSPIYLGSSLDEIIDGKLSNRGNAAFTTKDEAVNFIKSKTTDYTYETIQAI